MTQKEHDIDVKKLEDFSQRYPGFFKFKLALFTILGYGYIFGIILALSAILFLFLILTNDIIPENISIPIGIIILAPILSIVVTIFRSLLFHEDEPEGLEINNDRYKHLFNEIEKVRKTLGAKEIHKVVLSQEFDMYIYQRCRFGILGNYENYLVIGLPLMIYLSEEDFKIMLCREIAYLNKRNNRFVNWVYRVGTVWRNIVDNMEDKLEVFKFLYEKFLEWYIPRYDIYTSLLNEIEKSQTYRLATISIGFNNQQNALLTMSIGENLLEEYFWPKIYENTGAMEEPFDNIFFRMKDFFAQNVDDKKTHEVINIILNEVELPVNELMSLRNKLFNLLSNDYNNKLKVSQKYFENDETDIIDRISKDWKDDNIEWWTEVYEERLNFENLKEKLKIRKLSLDEMNDMILLAETYEADNLLKIFLDILEINHNHPLALYKIGELYLNNDNEEGIDFIEKAIKFDKDYIIEGYEIIYNYLTDKGRDTEANEYCTKISNYEDLLEKVEEAIDDIKYNDEFIEHDLSWIKVKDLVDQLRDYEEINRAYLVRKDVDELKDFSFYVLFLDIDRYIEGHDSIETIGNIMSEIFGRSYIERFLDRICNEIEFDETIKIFVLKGKELDELLYSEMIQKSKIYDLSEENQD
ncbi:hypothetical protein CLPU_13c00170 [Gottschalkia purinilytica]|uniref:Peptidase M48 domain-containing protein n=1 Tax=Gottschalkia purinilytica TaxID=1503 RepID=A0A0L0W8Q9_GOTPU|nr:hypothetical protein [Gottschalkia purinilytica]KNF07675.1 hypothetical protein CLPU_13c00170 [Gottschalkia purinilytica]